MLGCSVMNVVSCNFSVLKISCESCVVMMSLMNSRLNVLESTWISSKSLRYKYLILLFHWLCKLFTVFVLISTQCA